MNPVRKCIGCNNRFPKAELMRVVKNRDGDISLDPSQKREGRGAYVCPKPGCIHKAITKRQLNRAYRQPVQNEIYRQLEEYLEHTNG